MTSLLALLLLSSSFDLEFQAGKRAFAEGRTRDALAAFERAWDAQPVPETLINIAQCQRALGRRAEALASLKRFLVLAPRHRLAPAVEGTISELEADLPVAPPTLTPAAPPLLLETPPPPVATLPRWPFIAAGAVVAAGVAALVIGAAVQPPTVGRLDLPAR